MSVRPWHAGPYAEGFVSLPNLSPKPHLKGKPRLHLRRAHSSMDFGGRSPRERPEKVPERASMALA
jgi:hypothetical protein